MRPAGDGPAKLGIPVMKTLEEYKEEIEKDPKARRRLKKLEKEFEAVEESLTEEELVKYGLKPAEAETDNEAENASDNKGKAQAEENADAVLDSIARKMF